MIRHIMLVKLHEIHEGKNRDEQIEELSGLIENMMKGAEEVASFSLDCESGSLDPVDADICIQSDFNDAEALEEFSLNMEHLAVSIKVAEHAETILAYDLKL